MEPNIMLTCGSAIRQDVAVIKCVQQTDKVLTLVVAMHRTGDLYSSSILVRAMMVSAIAFFVTRDQASDR